MQISHERDGVRLRVKVEGILNGMTSDFLHDSLKTLIDENTHSVVLDLKNLDYISSAGLRIILFTYKKMQSRGEFMIYNAGGMVRDILELTGFTTVIPLDYDEIILEEAAKTEEETENDNLTGESREDYDLPDAIRVKIKADDETEEIEE